MKVSDDLDWRDPVAHINVQQQKIGGDTGIIASCQLEPAAPKAADRWPKMVIIMCSGRRKTSRRS
jgi:hypothetical protein